MELSAVGERVFAAEAILKRRVRKVSMPPFFLSLQKSRRGRGSPRRASRARTEDLFFNDNGEALL